MYVRKPSESPLSLISETLCKDVFRVKLFKPLFAQHLLQEALRHDALFQPSNLHISVTNQTDKEAKLAMKIGPNYWHCINSEGELMASAKFYISYLIGNNMIMSVQSVQSMEKPPLSRILHQAMNSWNQN